uniref:Uncharacterized protein n=1 Tax=Anguilla anguilla TaxID=7936 RepID=A0A0E9Q7R3_ANGAN
MLSLSVNHYKSINGAKDQLKELHGICITSVAYDNICHNSV